MFGLDKAALRRRFHRKGTFDPNLLSKIETSQEIKGFTEMRCFDRNDVASGPFVNHWNVHPSAISTHETLPMDCNISDALLATWLHFATVLQVQTTAIIVSGAFKRDFLFKTCYFQVFVSNWDSMRLWINPSIQFIFQLLRSFWGSNKY